MIPARCPITASRDPLDPSRHLGGGAARKRHQQNPSRIGAVDDQVRDPVRQGVGLAGPCAGDHQERRSRRAVLLPDAVLDGPPLLWIEGLKVGGGYRHGSNRPFREKESRSLIPVLFAMTSPGLRGWPGPLGVEFQIDSLIHLRTNQEHIIRPERNRDNEYARVQNRRR